MLDFLGDLRRTHMCGRLRSSDAGKKAVIMGWVNKRRDHGSLLFIDLKHLQADDAEPAAFDEVNDVADGPFGHGVRLNDG